MGAPTGNQNATKHGLRVCRKGLTLSRLPRGCLGLSKRAELFRRHVEDAVFQQHGEIDTYRASLIHSATTWVTHGLLAARWLRLEPDLTISERIELSKQVALSAEKRSACLKLLGLDRRQDVQSWIAAMCATPVVAGSDPAEQDDQEAKQTRNAN